MKKTSSKGKIALAVVVALILSLVIGAWIYVSDYYKADDEKIEAFMPKKTTEVYNKDYIAFGDSNSENGFVFYPGGKVESDAYIPLMRILAESGVFCILFDMPFNLAVLNIDAADGVCEAYPDIKNWYIGGHSLGGSMAASYMSDNIEEFSGLVLLASYSTADISDSGVRVLSVYGSEDGVMNSEKYEENKENLPSDFTESLIEGGCHAYFGMYGEQDGDGRASISAEEQIMFTADKILAFLNEENG